MSLINCPECGGQVSDTAAFCPHCGAPGKNVAVGGGDWLDRHFKKIMRLGLVLPLTILGGLALIAVIVITLIRFLY